jgi:hypothetical protein
MTGASRFIIVSACLKTPAAEREGDPGGRRCRQRCRDYKYGHHTDQIARLVWQKRGFGMGTPRKVRLNCRHRFLQFIFRFLECRPRRAAYLPAHALIPPLAFMKCFSDWFPVFWWAAYQSTLHHLLRVFRSTLFGSALQKITAAIGSGIFEQSPPQTCKECRTRGYSLQSFTHQMRRSKIPPK